MSCANIVAVGLHLASYHADNSSYNNVNPGVFIRSECNVQVGAYFNSVNRMSAYVAYTLEAKKIPVFATVGAATGYLESPIMPIAMVGLRSPDFHGFRLRIGFAPKFKGVSDTRLFHLMIERKF